MKGKTAGQDSPQGSGAAKSPQEKQAEFEPRHGETAESKPRSAAKQNTMVKVLLAFGTVLARSFATTLGRVLRGMVESMLKGDKGGRRRHRD